MIWKVSLGIAYLCLAIATYLLLKNKASKTGNVFLLVFIAGFVIYLPHYCQMESIVNVVLADLINLIQVITVNSNSFESLQGTIPQSVLFNHYLIVRGIVHIFLPILFAFTAVSFFFKRFADIRLKLACIGKKQIYVFSQINKNTILIVEDIFRHTQGKETLFVVCKNDLAIGDSELEDYFTDTEIGTTSVIILDPEKIPSFIKMNRHRSRSHVTYFCIGDNPDTNICDCLNIIDLYKIEEHKDNIHINVFADNGEEDDEIIDAGNEASISVRLIRKQQLAVYKLLMDHPLYSVLQGKEAEQLNVLIIGYSKLTIEFLKAVVWCGQLTNIDLNVNVLVETDLAKHIKGYFELHCPELLKGDYNIAFDECDLDSNEIREKINSCYSSANYIAICGDIDSDNIQRGMLIRRLFYEANSEFKFEPFIAVAVRNIALGNTLQNLGSVGLNYKLNSFGNERELYSYEELIESKIEHLAQNFHLSYSVISRPEEEFEIAMNALKEEAIRTVALKSYYRHEVKRNSNVTAAIHLQYKLWELGFELDETIGTADYSELKQVIDSELADQIAETEHSRWMAFYRTEGWKTVSLEEAEVAGYKRLSRDGKSELLHRHPDICAYEDISMRARKMGRADTTIYDRKMIEMIPYVLGDEWESNSEKKKVFKIKRRK